MTTSTTREERQTTMTKTKTNEAMSVDDIIKAQAARKAEEEAKKRAKEEAKKNAPKITEIWIKKLNINKSNPMNDTADIQLTWSDGKVEDTQFSIGTSGKTLDTVEWNDPNDANKDDDELAYQREVGAGGYEVKDGYLQMDKFYRDIVKSLRESVRIGRKFDHVEYPDRRGMLGSIEPSHKGNRKETSLAKGVGVYTGGKRVKNAYQEAGVKISDEDVRVCMVKFGFNSQPQIKWFYGKDKFEDPVWAFSRVKPDPETVKASQKKIGTSYEKKASDTASKGREVYSSGNTKIYKLF